MFKNYVTTAFRTLKKNRVYTFINVAGLALGMGCALVIFKVIQHHTSFDKHQEHFEQIYRISKEDTYPDRVNKGMGTPHPLGPAIKVDYPDLQYVVRTHYSYGDQVNVRKEDGTLDKFLLEEGIAFTESDFFKLFTVEWIAGDPKTALTEPNTLVITASTARSFFGLKESQEAEAMGRIVDYKNDYKVVGIIKDPPATTNFPFHLLFEYSGLKTANPYFGEGTNWNSTSSSTNTYILPHPGFDPAVFETKLVDLVEKYYKPEDQGKIRYVTQPLASLHFDKEYGTYDSAVSKEFLYALGIIALFLVLTACINFVNLATAQAANRAREIGIRKAIGSYSSQLITQFMSEIGLITLTAVFISLAVAEVLFIVLEEVIGHRLRLEFLNDPGAILFISILLIVVTVISGFYPAVLLARMNPILALKSKITTKKNAGGLSFRKGLVIVQFAISQFLIIGTLVVSAQMNYFNQKDLGFKKNAIVNSYLPDQDEVKRERFRNLMLESPDVTGISFMLSQPTGTSNSHSNFNYKPLQSEYSYHANFKACDEAYLSLFEIKLLAGRNVAKTDTNQVLINRKIANLMGFKDNYEGVLGEHLMTGWGRGDKLIVGVVEDFHTKSLEEEIDYVVMLYQPRVYYSLSFGVASGDKIKSALDHFRASWEEVYPEYVVDYDFLDEQIEENYESEQSASSLLRIFSLISIFIGCLGLYGLISFIAINRTKEIGVRKVLGASVMSILGLFTKEVITLTLIAFVVAAPLGYLVMNRWLEDYTYRITLSYEYFGVSFLITLVIAMITISHRSISSAIVNPAQTLKDE